MTNGSDPRARDGIVRDLEGPDEDVRRLALLRIEELSAEERLPLLAPVLGDPSWRVRKAAISLFVAMEHDAAVAEALIEALSDGENPGRRNAAVEALVGCGPPMVPALLEAAGSEDADVRKFVVDALAGIADPGAGARVIELLEDFDANVRAAAADALGTLGTPGSGAALLGRAVDPDEDATVRFSSLRALGALKALVPARDLAPVLEDPVLRAAGLGLLCSGEDEAAVVALLAGLVAGSRSVREAAMRSLVRMLGRSEDALAARLVGRVREAAGASPGLAAGAIERLREADLATRQMLIRFLGLLDDPRAAVPLLEAGRDEVLAPVVLECLGNLGATAEQALDASWVALSPELRRQACRLFGRTGGEAGAARLFECLEDPEPALRIAAIGALRERGGEGVLQGLAERLLLASAALDADSGEDFEVAEEVGALAEAVIAIAEETPAARVVVLLRSRLEGSGESTRLQIARVLGRIGHREDGRIAGRLLRDPSARVRRAAVEALARLEPGTAAEPLRLALADEAAGVRMAAVAALAASEHEEVLEDLLRLAEDPEAPVRAAAVRALGARFGGSSQDARRRAALGALDRALADEALVALGALEALTVLGGSAAERASTILSREEPELLREAARCLAAHGQDASLGALEPLIAHPDWTVRAEVIEALAGRLGERVAPALRAQLEAEKDEFVHETLTRVLAGLGD